MASTSNRRPHKSPTKTRGAVNRKTPAHLKGAEGPLEGIVEVNHSNGKRAVDATKLTTVPEEVPLKNAPGWFETAFVCISTVGLLFIIIFGANDLDIIQIMPKSVSPSPPQSVPFSAIGILRKVFSLPSSD